MTTDAKPPLVSVVMANYNGARYLCDFIDGVLRQTCHDLELIIVDDASTDGSVALVKRYAGDDPRVKLIETGRNAGPAAARNLALAAARGTWIAIADSDDIMHSARLEILLAAAEKDGADIAADNLSIFDADPAHPKGMLLTGEYASAPFWVDTAQYVRLNSFYASGPGLGYLKPLLRASLLAAPESRYDETLRIGEDYDLIVRLLRAGARYRVYPQALYSYRKHETSISHRLSSAHALALQAAHARFMAGLQGAGPELLAAGETRARSIAMVLSFNALVDALKRHQWAKAARIMLAQPRVALRLSEPIKARLARWKTKLMPGRDSGRPSAVKRAGLWLMLLPLLAAGAITLNNAACSEEAGAPRILKPVESADVQNIFGKEFKSVRKPARVFTLRKGEGGAVIADFNAAQNDRLRLDGFGLTDAAAVRQSLQQAGGDVVLPLPDGAALRLLNTRIEAVPESCFELELNRRGLVQTFGDEFNGFSVRTETLTEVRDGPGTWRTNYGHGTPDAQGSRSLPGNLQVYTDPDFRGTGGRPLGLDPFHLNKGVLEIWAERAPDSAKPYLWGREYTAGVITSKFSFSQAYGVFEIRARMPRGNGFWPAFWLLPADSSWPPEIDVFEVLTKDPVTLYSTVHTQATGEHTSAGTIIPVPDLTADFHVYSVEWQKDEVRWYFDGVEVARKPTPADMHKPMYVLANLAVGGDWPGNPDASTPFPGVFAIDWIRAYRRKPSP